MTIGVSRFNPSAPTQADDYTTVPEGVNKAINLLSGALAADAYGNTGANQNITLYDASLFPLNGGWITVGNEIISYTGRVSNTLQGIVRGAQGTTAAIHPTRSAVAYNFTATHFNVLAGSIFNLQQAFINFLPSGYAALLAATVAAGESAITAINLAVAGTINWARVSKVGSSLADLATRAHTDLTAIGTNTHAQIDTHIALTGTAHGAVATNTASQIVARDASGNFAAGIITATLTGAASLLAAADAAGQSAIAAINLATSGTINWARINKATSNLTDLVTRSHTDLTSIGTNTHAQIDTHIAATGSSAHGATSANTASQIVARDGSGNFVAGVITATLTGAASLLAAADAAGQSAITAINLASSGTINWARVSKSGSNLTDIATRAHTDLTSIGTNTHAQIDTHIAATGSSAHGATDANTASAIVARDASGNFAAGKITAKQYTDTISAHGNSGSGEDFDWSTAAVHSVTLDQNSTFTFSGAVAGQTLTLIILQDGTGSRLVTWPTISWPAATAPTLTTTASKKDVIQIFYDGTTYFGFTGGQNYT